MLQNYFPKLTNYSFQQRLNDNGRLTCKMRQELDLIRTVSIDEDLVWLRESILDLLQGEADWENEIEIALEQCGINVRLSDKGKINCSSVCVIVNFCNFSMSFSSPQKKLLVHLCFFTEVY